MKALTLLALAAVSLSLSSCAGFLEKAQMYTAQAGEKFEQSTGLTAGQGISLAGDWYADYLAARQANKIRSTAGTPAPVPSGKAVTEVRPALPVESEAWWKTIF